jgi:hypothetical protein
MCSRLDGGPGTGISGSLGGGSDGAKSGGWGNGGSVELVPPTPTIPAPCVPVDCKGIARPRAYDVNRDGTVSIKDSDAITKFLNSRSPSSRVTAQSEHLDANSDGWVDPQDVLAIIDALNESEFIAPPPTQIPQPTNTQTPMPTASSTATITATATSDSQNRDCLYYRLDSPKETQSAWDLIQEAYNFIEGSSNTIPMFSSSTSLPKCLLTMANTAYEQCRQSYNKFDISTQESICARGAEGISSVKGSVFDDTFLGQLFLTLDPQKSLDMYKLYQYCSNVDMKTCVETKKVQLQGVKGLYSLNFSYMDQNCKPVPNPDPNLLCGDLKVNFRLHLISSLEIGHLAGSALHL